MEPEDLDVYNGGFVRAYYRFGGNGGGFVYGRNLLVPEVLLDGGHLVAIVNNVDLSRVDRLEAATPTTYEDIVRMAIIGRKGKVKLKMTIPLRYNDERVREEEMGELDDDSE